MGGVETNNKGQVIDIKTDNPIAGLYAAGEATGGVHGLFVWEAALRWIALSTAASSVRKSPRKSLGANGIDG